MNKKGFAISVVLYTMLLLVIGIFYLLLGIVRNRYTVGNDLKEQVINGISPGWPIVGEKLYDVIEEKLPLTEPDIDGTRHVYGEIVDNYLWYSGKLWRIVSIDDDGTVKLVTHSNMTSLAWDTSSENTDYSTSQVRSWLNNEFLPTLYNSKSLLADAIWDYTTYTDFPTDKLSTIISVTEKVGLLGIYDFMKTGGGASSNDTFLHNGYMWLTISPKTVGRYVWRVHYEGYSGGGASTTSAHGIRPAINFKAGIRLAGGEGTKLNPFTILGDKSTGKSLELLTKRISGEYIKFNDVLYRIVGIEEVNGQKLTKVTMADYTKIFNSINSAFKFDNSISSVTYNPEQGIGLYLEEWYQADSTSETYSTTYIADIYKKMIATSADGVVWYIGPTSGTGSDYTLSKQGTPVSATIGIGYYGEMFSTQFGEIWHKSRNTWLITIYKKDDDVWFYYNYGSAEGATPTNKLCVRPSFYLKSDVKITSGTGMPHDPYNLTQ